MFVCVCVVCAHEKECLDVQIDHGMHCKAFSVASSVDTEEKGIHFSAYELVCESVCVCVCMCAGCR